MNTTDKTWIPADWPAPGHIRAGTTTRLGGVSRAPFDGFNLAGHVGDDPEAVAGNRSLLQSQLNLPEAPNWLEQRHSCRVVKVNADKTTEADGAYTGSAGKVCAVLTADCIPLLLCNRTGTEIAALHIGWRGLCKRIIKNALTMFHDDQLLAWLGPYISQKNYEVGADVVSACSSIQAETGNAIIEGRENHWYLDLGQLVKTELQQQGVANIYDCNQCTYGRKDLFYSYRRDGVTGRMASMIWKDTE